MRKIIVECDCCHSITEPSQYGTPHGWIEVSIYKHLGVDHQTSDYRYQFCPNCAKTLKVRGDGGWTVDTDG